MSLAYFREVHPPTAVDLAIKAAFTDERHTNLVLVKRSLLEVYRLVEPLSDEVVSSSPQPPSASDTSIPSSSAASSEATEATPHSPLLKLVLSYVNV